MKKIIVVILAIGVLIAGFLFVKNVFFNHPYYKVDFSKQYLAAASDVPGFEIKKSSSVFIAYYHPRSETRANSALATLEQAGLPLYKKYLGIVPKEISIYLADKVDEYIRISDFPGGKEGVKVGDGSSPNGRIYLYKPFDFLTLAQEAMVIHEGTHAVIYQFLGNMRYLPSFLNEGLAHFIEYIFKSGPDFEPLREINPILIKAAKTGGPKILTISELDQKCEGFISDETQSGLCRAEGTFIVWYINKNYGDGVWGKFLTELKQTQNWQKSLRAVTGRTTEELEREAREQLKLMASK